ncbi:B-cell CLL/lymphoma 9 protein-like isoform X2 [Littorina saxatilis]|uniref:B-cell CLL/lymphoma 9 protein-like isoform X2 n=1 Tax=Littorina saxatilis TaxID=31220 RepID=UPI0038B45B26
MKERREVAMLKESAKNKDVNGAAASLRDIKEEVKEEPKGHSARNTPDIKPPSNKMANGEAGVIKEENGGPMSVGSDNKRSPAGMGGAQGGPVTSRPESSVPGFIQQQSTIFVFSTGMANQAAESVKAGKHNSLISFHMESPSTQQSLAQRGQMGPGGRPINYPTMQHKPGMGGMPGPGPEMGGHMGPGMGGAPMGGPGMGPGMGGPPGMGNAVEQWVQEQNANLQQQQAMSGMHGYPMTSTAMGPNGPMPGQGGNMCPPGMMSGPPGSMGGPGGPFSMMDTSYEFNPDAVGPGGSISMPHINLSQNKVPNENLTPEQLKHRSEKFGRLSKLKGSLEMQGLLDSSGDMFIGPEGSMPGQQPNMSQQQAMMPHPGMMGGPGPGPGQGPPHPSMMSPSQQQQYMMQQQAHMQRMESPYPPGHPANFRPQGPGGPPGFGEMNQVQAQHAWSRLQAEFYDGKTMMHRSPHQQLAMMGGMGGPQGHPMNGPPPPYYSAMGPGPKRQPGPMGMVGSPTSPNAMMDGDPLAMFPASRSRPAMRMDPQAMEPMGPGGFGPGPSGMPPHSMASMGMMPGMEGPMMPGMEGPMMPGMSPQGPMGPQCHMGPQGPMCPQGPMGPQGPIGPQGPMPSGPMIAGRGGPVAMMGSSTGVSVVSSTSGRKNAAAAQVTLHRAGNPEQFMPDPTSANINAAGSKPPPSYAQAQKRKRDDMDDPFKNLQPTPSPTQLNYLNQFEGQELTITKQINSAYREPGPGAPPGGGGVDPNSVPPQPSHQHNTHFSSPASNSNHQVHSPMPHNPGNNNPGNNNPGGNPPSVKNPMSNSSQTSSTGHLGSPLHQSTGPSPHSGAGANMRLSHFDPPATNGNSGPSSTATSASGGMSSAPATPTAVGAKQQQQQQPGLTAAGSSSMSNITSASLANLAKGVENYTNQMTQNMMQGGPFHSIQVQGQVGNGGANGNSSSSTPSSNPPGPGPAQQPGSSVAPGGQPTTPKQYINNTNISQVNNYYMANRDNAQASLDVHPSMGGEGPHVSMSGGVSGSATMTTPSPMNGSMAGGMPPSHRETHHMQQQQHAAMMMTGGPGGMGASISMSQAQQMHHTSGPPTPGNAPMGGMHPGMSPSGPVKSPPYSTQHQPHPHPLPHPSMSTGMHQPGVSSAMGVPSNRLTSPSFPSSSVGNASVHIQPKAPNTIQYLPANPPPTQQPPNQPGMPGPPPAKRVASEMEMLARFGSPLDMKGNPTSTLQYFPGSPPNHAMRPHPSQGMPGGPPMGPEFSPQQSMEMQQAMMMRGGGPGPGPQDYNPMGPMGQGMHPGMSMGPNGPVGGPMHSPLGMDRMDMSGMGSPMDPAMMGPSPSAMRHVSALGPGGPGSMDPMSSMMGPGGGPPSGAYPGPSPSGYMPNGQSMMMSQHMQGPVPSGHPGSMPGMPMSHGGMQRMPGGPSGMRMQMPGGGGPGGGGGYQQYQQFQQQLYAQGRPRQMSPMAHMMGGPSGPGQPYMGMMPPNMPGPS